MEKQVTCTMKQPSVTKSNDIFRLFSGLTDDWFNKRKVSSLFTRSVQRAGPYKDRHELFPGIISTLPELTPKLSDCHCLCVILCQYPFHSNIYRDWVTVLFFWTIHTLYSAEEIKLLCLNWTLKTLINNKQSEVTSTAANLKQW